MGLAAQAADIGAPSADFRGLAGTAWHSYPRGHGLTERLPRSSWSDCIAQLAPQLVRIQRADRSGTGFIFYGTDGGARFIATAGHVIESSLSDHRPFFAAHGATLLRYGMPGGEDALRISFSERPDYDASVFAVINNKRLPKPGIHLVTPFERAQITEGVEVGWLGFPSLDHLEPELSFFSGRVSRIARRHNRYLIDGTNVPGCSGGPVFLPTPRGPRIIGTLTDYFPHTVADRPDKPFLPACPQPSTFPNSRPSKASCSNCAPRNAN